MFDIVERCARLAIKVRNGRDRSSELAHTKQKSTDVRTTQTRHRLHITRDNGKEKGKERTEHQK